ncbi:MAG: fluoride efflux transporter CrcB [Gammaproteobacteria bacterium]|nr:fluoride efflux transporter CrcB [Gammaproteobacteria bacterium]
MIYFKQLLLVGAGGFVGSILRFVIGGWAQRLSPSGGFPIGTLTVNLLGCLLIGVLGGLADYRQVLEPGQRLLLMVGLLGGFTTYSTFAYESLQLGQDGELLKVLANIVLHVVLGLVAAYAGYVAARMI